MRRKGELSPSMVNRDWPHQVAINAHYAMGDAHLRMMHYCSDQKLSLCPRTRTARFKDVDYVLFCFSDKAHAQQFMRQFGGMEFKAEMINESRAWVANRIRNS